MHARWLPALAVVGSIVAMAQGDAFGEPGRRWPTLEAEARSTAVALVRTINERRFERTCELMVQGATDPDRCVAGLRAGFMWSRRFRFRVTGVRVDGERAVVSALADGVPGRVHLVRVAGRYRVSSVSSDP